MAAIRRVARACVAIGITTIGFLLAIEAAYSNSEMVLYAFKGGKDGEFPFAGVIADSAGNFYGTTQEGGSKRFGGYGCGTAFKLTPDGGETILHGFRCGDGGANPSASLVFDARGNLYGTTEEGGGRDKRDCARACGTVFEIPAAGQESVLYAFTSSIGRSPSSGLTLDSKGDLYGTLAVVTFGYGSIYKLKPGRKAKAIYFFKGGNDGSDPVGNLFLDENGNLYGTTLSGGTGNGTVFEIPAGGEETPLYDFKAGSDGANPASGLIRDKDGNLYGMTAYGGSSCGNGGGCGTVFKLAPDGTETVLHAFLGGNDGSFPSPSAGLIIDKEGNLYGTTPSGGGTGCANGMGCGTVFEVSPDRTETILYAFSGGKDGAYPMSTLIFDRHDHVIGTASGGGGGKCSAGCGVVFDVAK